MTFFLKVLLYLGLSLNPWNPVLADALPKPKLRAVPSNVVATGNQVTFFCEGPSEAKEYHLCKEGSVDSVIPAALLETENKAMVVFSSVQWNNAGFYWCEYKTFTNMSQHSKTLELVVTGVHPYKVTLSAFPFPVVTSGENVTLQCVSQEAYQMSIIMEEAGKSSMALPSQSIYPMSFGARFPMGPVTPNQRWRFTCYGYYLSISQAWSVPSNHLEFLVSGILQKPTIWANPASVITLGSSVVIWCNTTFDTKVYAIYKEGNQEPWGQPIQISQKNKAKLIIPFVTELNAGRYHCYTYTSGGWSQGSEALELVVTGAYQKPTLLPWYNPVVNVGGSVTLSCPSNMRYDCFILTEDGQKLRSSQYVYTRTCQTTFQVGPVTSSQRWRFRCHGYYTRKPQVWSEASEPLQLLVSGSLNKPRLWAESRSVIASGSGVTILCEGKKATQTYFLYKEGSRTLWGSHSPIYPGDRAGFSIASVKKHHAGKYHCYSYTSTGWSERSDSLELVVTGIYTVKVTLSATSSPVVASEGSVTLQCDSQQAYNRFILMKEEKKFSEPVLSQRIYPQLSRAYFRVGPLSPNQSWRFTCYGYYLNSAQQWSQPSNDLEILVSGTLPKPTIWAHPGSVISSGSSVTIWCAGTLKTLMYVIHKEGSQEPSAMETQIDKTNTAKFHISSVTNLNAGRYTCYFYSSAGWTERSDTLELVVTGVHRGKPILSAFPSPVVTSGGNITLQCVSTKAYDGFHLTGTDLNFTKSPPKLFKHTGQSLAVFSEISVTSSKSGSFRCYGYYTSNSYAWSEASDPLEIHVSGMSRKPFLLTQQGSVLALGKNLTLQCLSEISYDRFALFKEGDSDFTQMNGHQSQAVHVYANFTLGSVISSSGGRYRCLGAHKDSSEWSAPSDILDIFITGHNSVTLNLSVHPGNTISSGENVTMLCQSSYPVDTFFLLKDGAAHPYIHQRTMSQDPPYEAKFSLSAVTASTAGFYTCFGSQSSSPYLMSYSSVPVEIIVSGLRKHQKVMIGASVVFFILLVLLTLFLLLRLRHQNKDKNGVQRKTVIQHPAASVNRDTIPQKRSKPDPASQEEILYATVKVTQCADNMELDVLSQPEKDSCKDLYAQVKPSRLKRAETTSSSLMPKKFPGSNNTQANREQMTDEQVNTTEELHDVTYAELHIINPRRGT